MEIGRRATYTFVISTLQKKGGGGRGGDAAVSNPRTGLRRNLVLDHVTIRELFFVAIGGNLLLFDILADRATICVSKFANFFMIISLE